MIAGRCLVTKDLEFYITVSDKRALTGCLPAGICSALDYRSESERAIATPSAITLLAGAAALHDIWTVKDHDVI